MRRSFRYPASQLLDQCIFSTTGIDLAIFTELSQVPIFFACAHAPMTPAIFLNFTVVQEELTFLVNGTLSLD
jgi:hypothetical protein